MGLTLRIYLCRLNAGTPYYIEVLEKAFDGSVVVELEVSLCGHTVCAIEEQLGFPYLQSSIIIRGHN